MDEKVVFNNTQSEQPQPPQDISQPSSQEEQPVETAQPEVTPAPDASEQVVPDQTTPTENAGTELQTEAGAAGEPPPEEGPPPPAPPFGVPFLSFLQNKMIKFALIGAGAFFLLLFIIMLLIPKNKTPKDVTLQWWGLWEDQNVVNNIIADFEKQNPHIKIEYVKQDPDQYRDRLLTRIQNSTGPDVFRYHNTWYPMLSQILAPLSQDVVTPDDFKKTYYPVAQSDLIQNGGIYGIPMGIDTLSLFVNTQLLQNAGVEVPKNWDDFQKAALKLTVKDPNTGKIKTAGAALGTYDNISHAPDILAALFAEQGVTTAKLSSDAQDESTVLSFYASFAIGDNATWDTTLDNSTLSFAKGNLAMYIGYSWDVFTIQQLNKNLNFKIYQLPGLYGVNKTIASYWVEGISSRSPNQQQAQIFMKYLAQKDTAEKFYTEASKTRSFGEPYARTDLASLLQGNPLAYPFIQQANNAVSSVFSSDTHDGDGGLNTVANNYLANAINTVTQSNGSAETAVQTLDEGLAQIFQKYGIAQQ
jgi:ABC-type glycerol-3-phosphate transport system substrate-binding protein